jgi:tRNA U38,U39,U40 pseudouridine synthase TruA
MKTPTLLHNGEFEVLKAGVHSVVLGMAAVCAAYNLAAWLVRRQHHSAVNAGLYAAVAVWECVHVKHHIDCRSVRPRRSRSESAAA